MSRREPTGQLEKGRWGGRRPGAGRKPGGFNAPLPTGTVGALSAAAVARRRLGRQEAAPEAVAALEVAYGRVADVLLETGAVSDPQSVLKAAAMVADAVAGPASQRHEHTGADGGKLEVVVHLLKPEVPNGQEEEGQGQGLLEESPP